MQEHMTNFSEQFLKIILVLGLLIGGFILVVSGIDTTTLQLINIYFLGIGVILMIVGVVFIKKM